MADQAETRTRRLRTRGLAERSIAIFTVAYLPRSRAFWQPKEAPDDAFSRLAFHDLVWGRRPAVEIGARPAYPRATGSVSAVRGSAVSAIT